MGSCIRQSIQTNGDHGKAEHASGEQAKDTEPTGIRSKTHTKKKVCFAHSWMSKPLDQTLLPVSRQEQNSRRLQGGISITRH